MSDELERLRVENQRLREGIAHLGFWNGDHCNCTGEDPPCPLDSNFHTQPSDAERLADELWQFEADVFHLLGEHGEPDKFGDCRCGVKNCPVLGRVNEWLRQRWAAQPAPSALRSD